METNEAIMAFSQSEKIKAGLIWLSQALELFQGLPEMEKGGAAKVVSTLLDMIINEVDLARTVVGQEGWSDVGGHIERAITMVRSGVGHDATIHLSRALSLVTNVGLESMTCLREKNLL